MASSNGFIFITFSLLLVLQSAHSATEPKRHPSISNMNTYIIQVDNLSKPSRFGSMKSWYASMAGAHILHTYDTVLQGFAVRLTDDEARRMSLLPGVFGVHRDRVYHTQTTRLPGFLGLQEHFGAWPDSDYGDGVIIGFVDTGIWPEHSSFNDSGLGPVRPTWRGKCVDADGFNASLCNHKLVGAKAFTHDSDGFFTPRDLAGHGTHVSATAAGSEVPGANMLGFSRGNAWGVAPKARIAMYKACNIQGDCVESDVVAAIDAAVSDVVDIISMSLTLFENVPLYDDMVAVATFGADRRGVFVVVAGGNRGPGTSTVTNVAPWMTTVGAGTTDRVFPAKLKLGNGVVLTGQSLYTMKADGTSIISLVNSSCGKDDLTPNKVMGKVVVCLHGGGRASDVQRAGGAGIIYADSAEWFVDAVRAQMFTLPALALGRNGSERLEAYVASVPYPAASFIFPCSAVTGENRAPIVAGFSSRGPNTVAPEIIKPDIIAPGVNILAAWTGESQISPPRREFDATSVGYNIISGTSVACAHVAGVAALIKKRRGEWTPAMVRSALMTTTKQLDNTGSQIIDNGVFGGRNDTVATPFEAGAGFIHPPPAMNPGLVYDAGTEDFLDFFCSMNYTVEQVRRFVPDLKDCPTRPGRGVGNLNYPSMAVFFDGRTRVHTLRRTLTKVSPEPETYTATVTAPPGVKVSVAPPMLVFKSRYPYEKLTYTVEFRSEAGGDAKLAGWEFGHILWQNDNHKVRSPLGFRWEK